VASFGRTPRGWWGRGRRLTVCCVPRDSTHTLFGLDILISIDRVVPVVSLVRRFKKSSHEQIKGPSRWSSGRFSRILPYYIYHSFTFSHSSAASVCSLYPSTVQPCPRRSRDLLGLFLFVICIIIWPPALRHYTFLSSSHQPLPRPRRAQHLTSTPLPLFRHVSKKPSFPYPNRPPQPAAHPPYQRAGLRADGRLPRPSDE
jgi:hypothetical protein